MRRLGICVVAALFVLPGCKKKDDNNKAKKKNVAKKKTPDPKKQPPKKQPPKKDNKLVDRGKYLVGIAGCIGCHTPFKNGMPDLPNAYSGGFEFKEPFGTWRSPNITQDKKTGIGDWSDQEIIDALRTGKRKDGTMMFPIMPYMMYNALTDDDAKAVVAFLRTIKPVENQVAGNTDLKLPKPPKPLPLPKEKPDMNDPVQKGKYLATVMHCAMCHVPMGPKGPDMTKAYAGGMKMEIPKEFEKTFGHGYLYAPNITPDKATGIGDWTEQDIVNAITKLVKKDGKPIMGPMNMYRMAWSQMPPDDAVAIAKFLKSLKPIKNKIPASKFTPPKMPKHMTPGKKGGGGTHKHGSGMGGGKGGGKSKAKGGGDGNKDTK